MSTRERIGIAQILNGAVLCMALALGGVTLYRLVTSSNTSTAPNNLNALAEKYGSSLKPLPGFDVFGDTAVVLGGPMDRPLVLYHFATTCGACRLNAPAWDSLATDLVGRASAVLISWEDADVLRAHFKNRPKSFDVVHISRSDNGWARDEYMLYATPVTYVINRMGEFVFHEVGAYQADAAEHILAAVGR